MTNSSVMCHHLHLDYDGNPYKHMNNNQINYDPGIVSHKKSMQPIQTITAITQLYTDVVSIIEWSIASTQHRMLLPCIHHYQTGETLQQVDITGHGGDDWVTEDYTATLITVSWLSCQTSDQSF